MTWKLRVTSEISINWLRYGRSLLSIRKEHLNREIQKHPNKAEVFRNTVDYIESTQTRDRSKQLPSRIL